MQCFRERVLPRHTANMREEIIDYSKDRYMEDGKQVDEMTK